MTRAGFVAVVGRPNVGKSTLVNRIVGGKVAIVSDKPQTTRRAIRGVATGEDWQLVLVDLPGSQRPRDVLTERMQRRVERELADSDFALFVVNGEQEVGPGDRFIARALRNAGILCVTAVNKIDRLDRGRLAAALAAVGEGKVTDTEKGDEEGAYEIEVTKDDGTEVDVHLDEAFKVISVESEADDANEADEADKADDADDANDD